VGETLSTLETLGSQASNKIKKSVYLKEHVLFIF